MRPVYKKHTSRLCGTNTMANTKIDFWSQLSKCLSKVGSEENGIITEPVFPSRAIGDHSLYYPLDNTSITRWFGQGDCATKTCSTLFHRTLFQLLQYTTETHFIRCFST